MADKKISELTSAGALAGTEVLPIVQSGETKKLALNAITTLGTIATGTWQGTQIANAYVATLTAAGKVANSATTATNANTASTIVARDASGNFSAGTITAALTGNVTGNVSGSSGSTTGNAATATTLQTARNINGVSFNGSADITVTAAAGTLTGSTLASGVTASSLTSVGTLTNLTVTNPITGSVTGSSGSTTGNAATATALQTARTINGVSFDGTANITVPAAAGTLTGSTLASDVTASSLTSVGTLATLAVSGTTTLNGVAYTWPASAGTNAYVLSTNGSGTLSWVAQTGGGGGGGTTTFALTAGSYLTGGSFDGSSAVTFAVDATSANTASKVVARDASGNFSAGAITASSIVVSGTTSLNSVAYTWPATAGTNGQILATNGAGTLSWVTGGGGGGGGTTTFPLTAGTYLTGGTFDGSAAVTFAVDGTSANTASKVVARDGSGNFAASVITGTGFQLSTTAVAAANVARFRWEADSGTAQIRLLGGNVDLDVGEDSVVRVLNDTGTAMSLGQVVYITGAAGQRPTVALASGASEATSTNVIGLVAEPIANNQEGFVYTGGVVKGLNTFAFNEGDLLYLSATTPGALTNVRPTQPYHGVRIGYVVRKNSGDGHVYLAVNNGYELEELHDVLITTPAANNMIRRNAGNTLWVNIAGPTGDVVGTTDSQTLTNKTISGSSNTLSNIGNGSLTNSSVTVNGTSIALGASGTVTAAAGTLTGTTLASNVVSSSLTSVGTIATGVWNGTAISDTYLATISTAGKVSNSATTAASANTASAIVARDASGNFSAGTITATLNGNASTATSATSATSATTATTATTATQVANALTAGTYLTSGGTFTGAAARTFAVDATDASTASKVVARDANGSSSFKNVKFNGTTSGTVTVQPAAAAGTWSLTLPTSGGSSGQVLTTDGSGVTSWSSVGGQTLVTTTTSYNITAADAGKQIVYTGSTANTPTFFVGASTAANMTTGQFVDVANMMTLTSSQIGIGTGQVFDTTFSQPQVSAFVRVMAQYSNGKVLVGSDQANKVVRLNADGSYDNTFTPLQANGTISDITISADESAIYVAGAFSQVTQSSTNYNYPYIVKLNGSTGAIVPTWAAGVYTYIPSQITSVAVSGTTVAVAYSGGSRRMNFFNTTDGQQVSNNWEGQYGGTNVYSLNSSEPIIKAHPSQANTFIIVGGNGYIYYDFDGNPTVYNFGVFHTTANNPVLTYSSVAYFVSVYTPNAVLVTSTHIYWAEASGGSVYLYRLTIGSSGSLTSGSAFPMGTLGSVTTVFRRATDNTFFVGTSNNTGEGGSTTGLTSFTSGLSANPIFPAFTFSNNGIRGVSLADGSLLLGNVVVTGVNTFLGKTVLAPEAGATIAYPPFDNGSSQIAGFTSTARQNFRTYQTMRLQKMPNGTLLVTQRNTPYQ